MSTLLEARDLSRSYDAFQALMPLDLDLESGQLTVLTGPNGAGKSTLLLCLSGLLRPTTGSISIEGYDLYRQERQAKQRLAFVADVPRFYSELTAWEHLQFIALAHGVQDGFEKRAQSLMEEFGIWEARDLFPHNYSRGMRLKLGLLLALIRPFKVLLLDEPTSALDPESVKLLGNKLKELSKQGATVLLSTHDLFLAENVANQRLILQHGQLVKESLS